MDQKIWKKLKKLKKEIEKLEPTSRINELKKILDILKKVKYEEKKDIIKEVKSDIENALLELRKQKAMTVNGQEDIPKIGNVNVETINDSNEPEKSLESLVESEIKEELKDNRVVSYGAGNINETHGAYVRANRLYQNPVSAGFGKQAEYSTSLGLQEDRGRRIDAGQPTDSRWEANIEENRGFNRFSDDEKEEKNIKSQDIIHKQEKYRRGDR